MLSISEHNDDIIENIDYIRIPFDILNTGISPDSIIENQRNMSKETVCSICLDIVYDPVMCGNCENLFCRHCINIQLEKSCKCPNKCIFEEKPINRVLKNLLNKFELYCVYKENGCKAIVLYSDYENHCKKCDFGTFKCKSPNCNFEGIKKEIIDHCIVCPFKLLKCKYCQIEILRSEFELHFKECENKLIECGYCKLSFKNKEMENHLAFDCECIEIKCENCNEKYKRKEFINHDEKDCLRHQVQYWKQKVQEKDTEILLLNQELQKAIKKGQSYIQFETKVFEKNTSIPSSPQSSFDEILNDIHLEEEKDDHIDNETITQIIQNKYRTEVQSTKTGLAGLIYTFLDLGEISDGLFCLGNNNNILFLRIPNLSEEFTLQGHTGYIWSIIHLKKYNMSYIASASQDKTIKIWNFIDKQCVMTLEGHTNWVTSLCTYDPDPLLLFSLSYDHNIFVWNIQQGKQVDTIKNINSKLCASIPSFDKYIILYQNNNNNICMYNYQTKVIIAELKGHTNTINCFADLSIFNKNFIGTGAIDATINIWNLQTYSLVSSLKGHRGIITNLSLMEKFNTFHSLLLSASDDHSIRLWSLQTFQCESLFEFDSWVKSLLSFHDEKYKEFFISQGEVGIIKYTKLTMI